MGNPFLNKYKEKSVILQAIGIIEIKSKETRVVAYTIDIRFLIGIGNGVTRKT